MSKKESKKNKGSTKNQKPMNNNDDNEIKQPVVNIGTIGQVDDGKSTLVQALTGKFPDDHSEELKRGISIRLGYADTDFRKCPECPEPQAFTTKEKCPNCGTETKLLRRVSFVDCPGHEILMATMLSGANLIDGAVLVIAANAPCPQPQTREHLAAMEILGISNIVIAQNKIELASEEEAKKNYKQIKDFIKNTIAKNAPIIPISAIHHANLDILIKAIEEHIPTPERDLDSPLEMHVARSFDVNRPGTKPENLKGGIIGGTINKGQIKVGDEIEITPGVSLKKGNKIEYLPITTKVTSIAIGHHGLTKSAQCGGLVAVGTELDPSLAKADKMAGNIITTVGNAPPIRDYLKLDIELLEKVVGAKEMSTVQPLAQGEMLMLNLGTAKTAGVIEEVKGNIALIKLTREVASRLGSKVAVSRRIEGRFRLIGVGEVLDEKEEL